MKHPIHFSLDLFGNPNEQASPFYGFRPTTMWARYINDDDDDDHGWYELTLEPDDDSYVDEWGDKAPLVDFDIFQGTEP